MSCLSYATSFGFCVLKLGKPLCCSAFTEHSWSPELGSKRQNAKGRTSGVGEKDANLVLSHLCNLWSLFCYTN